MYAFVHLYFYQWKINKKYEFKVSHLLYNYVFELSILSYCSAFLTFLHFYILIPCSFSYRCDSKSTYKLLNGYGLKEV